MKHWSPAVLVVATVACLSPLPLAAQTSPDPDAAELRNYELTVTALEQFTAASRQLMTAVRNDPRYGQMMKLQREMKTLQDKEEPTDADMERMEALATEMEALEGTLPNALDLSQTNSLSEMEAAIRREPLIANALESAGMAPRDYAKFALAFFQAAMIHGMQKSGMVKELPKELQAQVNIENIKFVEEHQAKIQALIKEFQALTQQ